MFAFYQRETKLGQAIVNKVNYCRKNPAHYEELQIKKLFGRVLDPANTSPSASLRTPTTPPRTPLRTKVGSSTQQTGATVIPSLPVTNLANAFSSMSFQQTNEYFGSVPHDEAIVANLTDSWRNRDLQIYGAPNVLVGSNPPILTTTITMMLTNIDPRWFSKDVENFVPFVMTQTEKDAVVFEQPHGWAREGPMAFRARCCGTITHRELM